MPILVLFTWRGEPDSLVAAYHREMADAPSVTVDQPQRTLHVFASREDGAVVVDLWENEDGFRRMRDDREFRRNVEAADWPSHPKVEIYPVRGYPADAMRWFSSRVCLRMTGRRLTVGLRNFAVRAVAWCLPGPQRQGALDAEHVSGPTRPDLCPDDRGSRAWGPRLRQLAADRRDRSI
jgi:hypothetical protein